MSCVSLISSDDSGSGHPMQTDHGVFVLIASIIRIQLLSVFDNAALERYVGQLSLSGNADLFKVAPKDGKPLSELV